MNTGETIRSFGNDGQGGSAGRASAGSTQILPRVFKVARQDGSLRI